MISQASRASGSTATGIPALTLQAPTQDLDAAFIEYEKILERSRRASYEKGGENTTYKALYSNVFFYSKPIQLCV